MDGLLYGNYYGNPGTKRSTGDMLYGASQNGAEYDMSSFFSVKPVGELKGLSVSDLYHSCLYRTVKNVRIPLQVGTISQNGQIDTIVYHDHIDRDDASKVSVQRIYVAVNDSISGNSLIQKGSAVTIVL